MLISILAVKFLRNRSDFSDIPYQAIGYVAGGLFAGFLSWEENEKRYNKLMEANTALSEHD